MSLGTRWIFLGRQKQGFFVGKSWYGLGGSCVAGFENLERRVLLSGSDLDPGFGQGGVQKLDYQNLSADSANVVVPLTDGRLLVAGRGSIPGVSPSLKGGIARYNPDGTPDLSFGDRGKVNVGNGPILGVVAQGGGKLLVLWSDAWTNGLSVTRLNADGTPDSSFANSSSTWPGTVVLTAPSVPAIFGSLAGIAALPDDRFLVGGTYGGDLIVRRFAPNGQIDTTFGTNGQATIDLGPLLAVNYTLGTTAIGTDAAGRILLAATGQTGTDWSTPVVALSARLSANGAPDSSFGTNGVSATVPLPKYDVRVNGLAIDKFGRPLATVTKPDVSVVRWTTDGRVDTGFSGDGVATLSIAAVNSQQAMGVTAAGDGGVIVVGSVGGDAAVVRFTPSGMPDAAFGGGDGWLNIDGGGGNDVASAAAELPDGRIVVVGSAVFGGYGDDNVADFLVARLAPNGITDPTWAALSSTLGS